MNNKTNHTIKNQIPRCHLGKRTPATPVPRWHLGNKKGILMWAWELVGRTIYFITWPGIWLVVRLTPPRTRIAVEHRGELLVTKDWLGSGQWNLPGGGLHHNEDKVDGALRELFEETGVVINSNNMTYIKSISVKNGMPTTLHFFHTKVDEKPEIRLQKFEILDYRWIDVKHIRSVNLNPASSAVVAALYEV